MIFLLLFCISSFLQLCSHLTHPHDRHDGLVLERRSVEVQVDGEELGVLHERGAVAVEGGEAGHEPAQLEDDVLHVLVVQQLHLDEDVGAQLGEASARVSATAENQSEKNMA